MRMGPRLARRGQLGSRRQWVMGNFPCVTTKIEAQEPVRNNGAAGYFLLCTRQDNAIPLFLSFFDEQATLQIKMTVRGSWRRGLNGNNGWKLAKNGSSSGLLAFWLWGIWKMTRHMG